MPKITIRLDTLRALLPCSSKDETRLNLCGIHVASKDGTVRLTATDAIVLAMVSTATVDAPAFEAGVVVRRGAIDQILKVAGKKTTTTILDTETKTLTADSFSISDVLVDSAFPNEWRLLPEPDAGVGAIFPPFDLRNVAKFEGLATLRYAGGATKKDLSLPIMSLVPCGPPPTPILVRIDGRPGETIAGIICPCRE